MTGGYRPKPLGCMTGVLLAAAGTVLVVLLVVLGSLAIGALPAAGAQARPALATMDGQLWLIKSNDLAVLGGDGSYAWTGCGLTTDPADVARVMPCAPGQDRIYASYWKLRDAARSGAQPRGSTAILDPEGWPITPLAERLHQQRYLRLAGLLARRYKITLIEAPVGRAGAQQQAYEVTAARYASVVDIQDQYLDARPAAYRLAVRSAVTAMRRVSRTVIILAGLAPDAGGRPVTAGDMAREYRSVRGVVQGGWLNANRWPLGTGCAPQGCPGVVRRFLADIGVAP